MRLSCELFLGQLLMYRFYYRYATSPELNTFSALIQNFYASNGEGTFPHPAVHLTLSTIPGKDIAIQTYISSAVGVNPDRIADSCLFVPVPHEIRYAESEKSGRMCSLCISFFLVGLMGTK
jgi:hypothetical protein